MPSDAAVNFVASRGRRLATVHKLSSGSATQLAERQRIASEAADDMAARQQTALRVASGNADPTSMLVLQRMQQGGPAPDVLPAGTDPGDGVILRAGPVIDDSGEPLTMDGLPVPGNPEYDQALKINGRTLRRVPGTNQVVEVDEPLIMSAGAPRSADSPPLAETTVAPVNPPPAAIPMPAAGGFRTIVSFGPKEGILVVTVEDGDGEVAASAQVDGEAVKKLVSVFRKLGKFSDRTGGALD